MYLHVLDLFCEYFSLSVFRNQSGPFFENACIHMQVRVLFVLINIKDGNEYQIWYSNIRMTFQFNIRIKYDVTCKKTFLFKCYPPSKYWLTCKSDPLSFSAQAKLLVTAKTDAIIHTKPLRNLMVTIQYQFKYVLIRTNVIACLNAIRIHIHQYSHCIFITCSVLKWYNFVEPVSWKAAV